MRTVVSFFILIGLSVIGLLDLEGLVGYQVKADLPGSESLGEL